jgi:hypothetical protein
LVSKQKDKKMNSSSRSRFLASVKSRLLLLSSDLANLTISDLEALKWSQKQKIVFNLFENSSFCSEFFPELVDLQEKKSHDLSKMKKEMKESNSRIEIESDYRTSAMRILLKALERYSWPPTMEAFSDPLNDLMINNDLFLQAIDFLISLEFSSSISSHVMGENVVEKSSTSSSSSSSSSSSQRPPLHQRSKSERLSSVRHLNQDSSSFSPNGVFCSSREEVNRSVVPSSTSSCSSSFLSPREKLPASTGELIRFCFR